MLLAQRGDIDGSQDAWFHSQVECEQCPTMSWRQRSYCTVGRYWPMLESKGYLPDIQGETEHPKAHCSDFLCSYHKQFLIPWAAVVEGTVTV